MKTSRLVLGIISIVLFVFISFQSCAAGVANTLDNNGEVSGTAGFLLALCMLTAGIIGICCRKIKSGTIVSGAIYAIGGLIGIANVGSYSDLQIWSVFRRLRNRAARTRTRKETPAHGKKAGFPLPIINHKEFFRGH